MCLAVVQLNRRPHLIEARFLENLFAVERRVPLRHIENRQIERAIRGGIEGGRNPFLILQFSFYKAVTGGAVGDDVSLADDASRVHAERLENTLLNKVYVELPGHSTNHNAEHYISKITIAQRLRGHSLWQE